MGMNCVARLEHALAGFGLTRNQHQKFAKLFSEYQERNQQLQDEVNRRNQ